MRTSIWAWQSIARASVAAAYGIRTMSKIGAKERIRGYSQLITGPQLIVKAGSTRLHHTWNREIRGAINIFAVDPPQFLYHPHPIPHCQLGCKHAAIRKSPSHLHVNRTVFYSVVTTPPFHPLSSVPIVLYSPRDDSFAGFIAPSNGQRYSHWKCWIVNWNYVWSLCDWNIRTGVI